MSERRPLPLALLWLVLSCACGAVDGPVDQGRVEPRSPPLSRDAELDAGDSGEPDGDVADSNESTPRVYAPEPTEVGAPGRWVLIPAGTFVMGSPPDEPGRRADEEQREVTLTRDFLLQTTEVTQDQFESVMGYNPSKNRKYGGRAPVDFVSWYESAAYCNALSRHEGLEPCYVCNGNKAEVECAPNARFASPYECPGYRHPTSAEWEYAARAGTKTALYTGPLDVANEAAAASVLAEIAWWCRDVIDQVDWDAAESVGDYGVCNTRPVGQKTPNAWGLYDLFGNVTEDCFDTFQLILPGGPVSDPWAQQPSQYRTLRGGGISSRVSRLRAGARSGNIPHLGGPEGGFRPARTFAPGVPPARFDATPSVASSPPSPSQRPWVRVTPGKVVLGAHPQERGQKGVDTRRDVTFSRGFEIAATEVTQGDFEALMGYNPSHFRRCGESCPVEDLSIFEAMAYCNALSKAAGVQSCYRCTGRGRRIRCEPTPSQSECRGYRIPTEDEWEYAARGGTTTATYNGDIIGYFDPRAGCTKSIVLDPIAWYCHNSGDRTREVAKRAPNPWGLYDVIGNVREYCLADNGGATFRGGHIESFPREARVSFQFKRVPLLSDRDSESWFGRRFVGVRPVKTIFDAGLPSAKTVEEP